MGEFTAQEAKTEYSKSYNITVTGGPNSDGIGEWIFVPRDMSFGVHVIPAASSTGEIQLSMAPKKDVKEQDPTTGDAISWDQGLVSSPATSIVQAVVTAFRLRCTAGSIKVHIAPREI